MPTVRQDVNSYTNKFGYNAEIKAVTETIWTTGGVYAYPAAAAVMEIVSGDALDGTGAATGALTATVYGQDASFNPIQTTVTLNGLTPVVMTGYNFYRVYRVIVNTAGSGGVNAGILTVRPSGGGTTYTAVAIGTNQTEQAFYTIPAGHVGIVSRIWTDVGSSLDVTGTFWARPDGGVFAQKWRHINLGGTQEMTYGKYGPQYAAGTDLEMRGITTNAAGNVVGGGFDVLLVIV